MNAILLLILAGIAASTWREGSASPLPLRFRAGTTGTGVFKIVQFTDEHFDSGDWNDGNATLELMRMVLKAEAPVDLVAVTGDTACLNRTCYRQSVLPMEEAGVPWAFINGNHDLGDRSWELGYDMNRTLFPLSITQSLFNGTNSTYLHSILSADGSDAARANLWFFDSGADNCLNVEGYNCVSEAQINWYREQTATEAVRAAPYGMAFVHIPLQEMLDLWNNKKTTGFNRDVICCSSVNTGLYSAFVQVGGVDAVFSGHDHYNDFYGQLDDSGILVGYGRKTGMSGRTGGLADMGGRGARVFLLTDEGGEGGVAMKTWVRREDGTAPAEPQNPQRPPISKAQLCCGSTAQCPWQP